MLLVIILLIVAIGIAASFAFSNSDGVLFAAVWVVLGIAAFVGIPAVMEMQAQFQDAIALIAHS